MKKQQKPKVYSKENMLKCQTLLKAKKDAVNAGVFDPNDVNNITCFFVPFSDNKKLGKMAVLYISCLTCPPRCPFKAACYADQGPCKIHWLRAEGEKEINKISSAAAGLKLSELVQYIKSVDHSEILRLNVAGDIAIYGTNDINENIINVYKKVARLFKKVYTYTHCDLSDSNIVIVKEANKIKNLCISFSCENLADVEKARAAGVPAVLACETMQDNTVKINNTTYIKCRNVNGEKKQCKNCKMCMHAGRACVPVFPVHGGKKQEAINAGFLSNI